MLSQSERRVLCGILANPTATDKHLSQQFGMSQSTFTVIRQRLRRNGYYRLITVPLMQNLGCEMLALIYTDFNPMVPLDIRIQKTRKIVEPSREIFLSIGELEKGFSLSFSKNYTELGKINDARTTVFGEMQLIEKEYPKEVLFPFEISTVYRFLNFAPFFSNHFGIKLPSLSDSQSDFKPSSPILLSDTEKTVYCSIIENPEASLKEHSVKLGLSTKTISSIRKRLEGYGLLKWIAVPDLKKLNIGILALHIICFNPQNPPDETVRMTLVTHNDILAVFRKFEGLRISIYSNYDEYEKDRMHMFRYLREHNYVVDVPLVRAFSLNSVVIIKDFDFSPIVKKMLGSPFKA